MPWEQAREVVGGAKVHKAFEEEVKGLGYTNVRTEVSYIKGEESTRGAYRSIRLDVGVYDPRTRKIRGIYDLKLNSARLTEKRANALRSGSGSNKDVTVTAIKP